MNQQSPIDKQLIFRVQVSRRVAGGRARDKANKGGGRRSATVRGRQEMTRLTALFLVILMMAACAAALADDEKTPIAVSFQVYYPTSSETKDVFGNAWTGFGLDVLRLQDTEKWRPLISFHGMTTNDIGDATIIAANFGMQKTFGDEDDDVQPFVVLQAGPYWGDVEVPSLGVDESKLGFNANVEGGIIINKRFQLKVRYDYYSRIGGFSFDGFTISAGIKLFEL